MFTLQNSRGEVVDLDSDDLFGYTPTGLGAVFSNSYSQYDSYFKPTKKTIQQGQMSLNILFGSVESNSYQTFSDFASFLAYEPLTLIYTTKSESWYRDAVLSSLTKTEIGGTTVIQVDRLVEQFTIDFINPWYNNKTAEYKSYDADPNLAIYGKGYFNETNPATVSPNLVLFSSGMGATGVSDRPVVSGATSNNAASTISYQSDGMTITNTATNTSTEWYYQLITAWQDITKTPILAGKPYTLSLDAMGTAKQVALRWGSKEMAPYQALNYTNINNTDWTRVSFTFTLPAGTLNTYLRIHGAVNNQYVKGFTGGETLRVRKIKLEQGTTATDWTPAVSESKTTWNYGYFNVNSETIKKNQAYADLAKTDITYIEN